MRPARIPQRRLRAATAGLLAVLFLLSGCVSVSPRTPAGGDAPDGTASLPDLPEEWPDLDAARIRPGVRISPHNPFGVTPELSGCTANFVFASPDNATLYLGGAAHCADGQRIGDETPVADGLTTARLAYCSFLVNRSGGVCETDPTSGDRNDFALFELKPADRGVVHPAILGWNGPVALGDCTNASIGDAVVAYGNSTYKGEAGVVKGMTGTVVGRPGDGSVTVRFVPAAIPADSGSPVLDAQGRAFGVVRAVDFDGTNSVTCLDFALAVEAASGGPPVVLATWSG